MKAFKKHEWDQISLRYVELEDGELHFTIGQKDGVDYLIYNNGNAVTGEPYEQSQLNDLPDGYPYAPVDIEYQYGDKPKFRACNFETAKGFCQNDKSCAEHSKLRCVSCDKKAVKACDILTGIEQEPCGAPLCKKCKHEGMH